VETSPVTIVDWTWKRLLVKSIFLHALERLMTRSKEMTDLYYPDMIEMPPATAHPSFRIQDVATHEQPLSSPRQSSYVRAHLHPTIIIIPTNRSSKLPVADRSSTSHFGRRESTRFFHFPVGLVAFLSNSPTFCPHFLSATWFGPSCTVRRSTLLLADTRLTPITCTPASSTAATGMRRTSASSP